VRIDSTSQIGLCGRESVPALLRWADATARLNHLLREAERLQSPLPARPRDEYRPGNTGLMPKLGEVPAARAACGADAAPIHSAPIHAAQPAQVRAVGKFIDLFA
jgi:hypothetical protein